MLERLEEIIYQVTGKNNLNLTDDTDFVKDLELNSFDVMNIISALEDLYDVDIPTRDVWQLRQVKDAVEYLKAKGVEQSLPVSVSRGSLRRKRFLRSRRITRSLQGLHGSREPRFAGRSGGNRISAPPPFTSPYPTAGLTGPVHFTPRTWVWICRNTVAQIPNRWSAAFFTRKNESIWKRAGLRISLTCGRPRKVMLNIQVQA